MQILKAGGEKLSPLMFIKLFAEARKLAPARFMTLRLHPDRYADLCKFSVIPESIQLGPSVGPMGKVVMRVNCIKPPISVADGIAIKEDEKCDKDKLYFELHGQPELVVEELYYEPAPQSTDSPTVH